MPAARPRRITRFTVMATLQAARAKHLGLPESSAFSWGLNRAIFYAAAKRGFKGIVERGAPGEPTPSVAPDNTYRLGDDYAYRDPESSELLFTIGGDTQTEEGFRKQVAARFGGEPNFQKAWSEALEIVNGFDEDTLKSGRQFYSVVYKPRRDDLVAEWTEKFGERSERGQTALRSS